MCTKLLYLRKIPQSYGAWKLEFWEVKPTAKRGVPLLEEKLEKQSFFLYYLKTQGNDVQTWNNDFTRAQT